MDVTSLYTSIPHTDGIEACREAWDQRAVREPQTECLVQLLTLVLKHNNFTFNGEHFFTNQRNSYGNKDGTFIRQHLHGDAWKTNHTICTLQANFLVAFHTWSWQEVDRVEEDHNRFFDHANYVHPTIRFTHETSRNKISFLDTYTTCENGIMSTDIYNKRQIHINTCPHRVVILNIAPKVFRTAKLSESNASAPMNKLQKKRLGELKYHL